MSKVWQARTKAPTKKDLYYVAKDEGGYNAFTKGNNIFNAKGNCTSYCFGRWLEEGSISAKGIIKKTCKLPLCNAGEWFSTCKAYEKGQTPKNGAVAVWKGGKSGCGHVVIVETYDDKYIYCTESGYAHYLFKSTKYPLKNGKPQLKGYTFEGYIYNPDAVNNWQEVVENKPATSTTYKARVTATSGLNVRKTPATTGAVVKVLKFGTICTIYETNGKWGRIGVDQWVCLDYMKGV